MHKIPVVEDWEKFLQYLRYEKKFRGKKESVCADKSRYLSFCRYFQNKDFTRENFINMLQEMEQSGKKNSTLNKFVSMGKNIDSFLKVNELAGFSYFDEERLANVEILLPDEVMQLANVHINYQKNNIYLNKRNQALILLLGLTGCRISEALSLTVDDIFSNIPAVEFKKTKNYEDRIVPITNELCDMLLTLPRGSKRIFETLRGNLLGTSDVNTEMKIRANAIGLKKRVYCHLFRHSYITTMLNSGVDSVDVCNVVGHRDPRTLMRYYHPDIQRKKQIMLMHPLLRKNKDIYQIEEESRNFFQKILDREKYLINVNVTEEGLNIDLKIKHLTVTG